MRILPATAAHARHWTALRCELWPGDDHAAEIDRLLAERDPEKLALLAFEDAGDPQLPFVLSLSKHRPPSAGEQKDDTSTGSVQTDENISTNDPLGLAEASLRHDYVNGCDGSPVLFLEGLYVVPAARRRGVARALCDAVAGWGRTHGVAEFASDAPLDNGASHALHAALGFAETERIVCFRRLLGAPA